MPLSTPTAGIAGIEIIDATHPAREEAEQFIRRVFRQRFEANLGTLMPHLLVFRDADHRIVSAVGLRSGLAGPLFVERYLGEPAELRLQRLHGGAVSRRDIVEFGNFAARTPGSARCLILTLLPALQDAGLHWVLFVATRQLRNTFDRLGLVPVKLQPAEPHQLGEDSRRWGRYYEAWPDVMAGDLRAVPARAAVAAEPPCALTLQCGHSA